MNLLKKFAVMGLVAVFSFAMVGMTMAKSASDYSTQSGCSDASYYWYGQTETCYETENAKLSAQVSYLMDQISELTATITKLSGGGGTQEPAAGGNVPAECEGVKFDRSLTTGMSGDDVLCLQTMLNQDLESPIADSGAGSPGNETSYFGSVTKGGVVTFQEEYSEDVLAPYDFSQGTGYVGKTTKAKLNELLDNWASEGGGEKVPGDYTEQSACEDAGYYWYDEACNESEQQVTGKGLNFSAVSQDDFIAPQGATRVNVLEFKVEAGEDVTLEDMAFKREGFGSDDDFESLTLYKDGERLTSGRSLSASSEVTFNGLNYDLEEGDKVTLSLQAETVASGHSGNQDYFELTSVDSEAEVSGLPLEGPQVSLASAGAGSLTYNFDDEDSDVNVGDKEATLEEVTLGGVSNEDAKVEQLTLTQYGTVDMSDLRNLVLQVSGDTVAEAEVSGDQVSFVFDDPYMIEDGDGEDFTVVGDISSAAYIKNNSGTIDLRVDDTSDVYAVGADYGFGLTVSLDSNAGDSNSVTIKGSDVNLSYAGPGSIDISDEVDEQELFSFDISAVSDLDATKLVFNLNQTINSGTADEFYVVDGDGTKVAGPEGSSVSSSSSGILTFDSTFAISEGESTYSLVADIEGLDNGDSFDPVLDLSNSSFKNVETGERDIETTPTGTLTGKELTVQAATLSAELKAHPAAQTYVAGADKAELAAFNLDMNEVTDADINSVDIGMATDTSSNNTGNDPATLSNILGEVYLYMGSVEDGVLLDSDSSAENLTFDVDNTLQAGNDFDLVVAADVSNTDFDGDVTATLDSIDADVDKGTLSINGSSITGNSMTIAGSGSLAVSLSDDNNPTDSGIVEMGSTDNIMSAYTLGATNENIEVDEVGVTIGTDGTEDVNYTNIALEADGKIVEEKPVSGKVATFTNNFIVDKDADTELKVLADFATEADGANSGAVLAADLNGVVAEGSISDEPAGTTTAGVGGATEFGLFKSRMDFAITAKASELTGVTDAMKFEVSAGNNAGVQFNELAFDVDVSNATVTEARLVRGSDIVATTSASFLPIDDSNDTVRFAGLDSKNIDNTISADSSQEYTLRLVSDNLDSGDSVTVNFNSAVDNYEWDDGTRADSWVNGTYLTIPNDLVSFSKQ